MTKRLSRALLEAKRTRNFKGIKIGRAISLSRLLFMDDILLFCDGSIRYHLKLKEIINLCCLAIGMKVNLGKSSRYFMGIIDQDVRLYIKLFHILYIYIYIYIYA
jgi:hypothetical protein